MGRLTHTRANRRERNKGMDLSICFESALVAARDFLYVMPLLPLGLYVMVYCHQMLTPLVGSIVKRRSVLRSPVRERHT